MPQPSRQPMYLGLLPGDGPVKAGPLPDDNLRRSIVVQELNEALGATLHAWSPSPFGQFDDSQNSGRFGRTEIPPEFEGHVEGRWRSPRQST